jgi:hypothetical protein
MVRLSLCPRAGFKIETQQPCAQNCKAPQVSTGPSLLPVGSERGLSARLCTATEVLQQRAPQYGTGADYLKTVRFGAASLWQRASEAATTSSTMKLSSGFGDKAPSKLSRAAISRHGLAHFRRSGRPCFDHLAPVHRSTRSIRLLTGSTDRMQNIK